MRPESDKEWTGQADKSSSYRRFVCCVWIRVDQWQPRKSVDRLCQSPNSILPSGDPSAGVAVSGNQLAIAAALANILSITDGCREQGGEKYCAATQRELMVKIAHSRKFNEREFAIRLGRHHSSQCHSLAQAPLTSRRNRRCPSWAGAWRPF